MQAQKLDLQAYFEALFKTTEKKTLMDLLFNTTDQKYTDESLQMMVQLSQNQFIEPKKFFTLYSNFEKQQALLSGVWDKMLKKSDLIKDLKKKKLKYIMRAFEAHIRAGVPFSLWKDVLLPFFKGSPNFQEQYDLTLNIAFNGKVPSSFKNTPLFSHSNTIEEVITIDFLSFQGMEVFKRLMWVLEKSIPKLNYNPMLPQIVNLLLIYFTEAETYGIVKSMFEKSRKPVEAFFAEPGKYIHEPNWFLTFKKEEYKAGIDLIALFIEFRGQGFSSVRKHFREMKFDIKTLCAEAFNTLFLDFFNISTVIRIFGTYLIEGISVYYRITLSMLKLFQNEILSCKNPNDLIPKLKYECHKITAERLMNLFSLAFELKIRDPKRGVPTIVFTNPFRLQEGSKLYLPTITDESLQISSQHLEAIWEWLPLELKLTKPILAYSSKVHGWSLKTLCHLCSEGPECFGMILFIRTGDCIAFGAFVDTKIEIYQGGNKPKGSNDCFVFQLEPIETKYKATGKNKIHLVCDSESISFGAGKEGAAISLDNDLLFGYTNKSETYDNEPLNLGDNDKRGRFQCLIVEAYWLR